MHTLAGLPETLKSVHFSCSNETGTMESVTEMTMRSFSLKLQLREHLIHDVPWTFAKLPVNTYSTNLLLLILKDCILLPQIKTMKLKQKRHHTHPTLHVKREAVPLLPFSHNLSPSPNPTHLKPNQNQNQNRSRNKTSSYNSLPSKNNQRNVFRRKRPPRRGTFRAKR
jgi:hypothetical protein